MRDGETWLRRIDTALVLAALAAVVYVVTRLPGAGEWGWGLLTALGAGAVLATPVALVIGRRDHRLVLDTPVLMPAALLLPGSTAVLATILGVGAGTAVRLSREGRPVPVQTLRAVAIFSAAVSVQAWLAERLAVAGTEVLVTVLVLEIAYLAVALPAPILRGLANQPERTNGWWRQLVPSLLVAPVAALTAAAIVLLVQAHGLLGLVGYAPVLLLLALGRLLTATQQDRRRLNALYALAVDTTDVTDENIAFDAALTAARHVVAGARVSMRSAAGADGDLSVRLGPDRWLVAERRSDAFTPDDEDLLAAVVRLATTSAHRALLHQELERQERVKTALLASVGHDLQNPLAVQQGLADTLVRHRGQLDGEQLDDLLARIGRNARRMSRMVAGLVDLERLELSEQTSWCDAGRTIAAWAARVDLPNGRFLDVRVDEEVPTPVGLEACYLERVVENLAANAARYSPREEPITVRVEAQGPDVLVAVEDRGSGVPEADRERIFRALDQGTSGAHGSVGLGLFIVARFVEHGRGRIAVHDRPGGGASFQILLPVADHEQVEAAERSAGVA